LVGIRGIIAVTPKANQYLALLESVILSGAHSSVSKTCGKIRFIKDKHNLILLLPGDFK
jgi:hypothetical protein